jgi:hypothetical protein
MSRQILPIAGACVVGVFRPRRSWWRRALIWLAHVGLRHSKPLAGYAGDGDGPLGGFVDPVRIKGPTLTGIGGSW